MSVASTQHQSQYCLNLHPTGTSVPCRGLKDLERGKGGLNRCFLPSYPLSSVLLCFQGPMKAFAMHLGKIHKKFNREECPIRTYLVTARSGRDMGIRAIKTLREWGLAIDEAFFMDGAPKGPILAQIQPHIFFDDGLHNIQGARDMGVPSAWVPSYC